MTLATSLAELKASLDQGNEALTTKHFRLLVQALEEISFSDVQTGDANSVGWLDFTSPTTLTIATGVVTADASCHVIDTEAAAAADDLDTINGGTTGKILILRSANNARVVTVKDNTGNLRLAGDCVLDNAQDTLMLIASGAAWLELSRSNNG